MSAPRRALNAAVGVALAGAAIAVARPVLVALAIAGAAAASIEVLRPLHPRRRPRAGLATDLVHAVGNRFFQLPATLAALAVLAPVATWLVPGPVRSGLDGLPWWAQTGIVFVLSDLATYIGHRALHRVPLLWRLHAVHHSSEQLDWLATARAHPLDQAFTVTTTALPAIALGVLDAHPWLLTLLFLYYPFVSHANADLHLPRIERIVVTPRFHHWHHAANTHAANFGGFLAVWDHLFGTAHPAEGFPDRYGIDDAALVGDDYLGHVLSPVRRRGSDRRDPWVRGRPEAGEMGVEGMGAAAPVGRLAADGRALVIIGTLSLPLWGIWGQFAGGVAAEVVALVHRREPRRPTDAIPAWAGSTAAADRLTATTPPPVHGDDFSRALAETLRADLATALAAQRGEAPPTGRRVQETLDRAYPAVGDPFDALLALSSVEGYLDQRPGTHWSSR